MTRQTFRALAATAFVGWLMAMVALFTLVAHGQPAPSSQPVIVAPVTVPGGGWAWFVANSQWIVGLVVMALSTLATGLSDYPKAAGLVKALRMGIAAFSLVQFKDGAGSLKVPLVPPALPPGSKLEQPKA